MKKLSHFYGDLIKSFNRALNDFNDFATRIESWAKMCRLAPNGSSGMKGSSAKSFCSCASALYALQPGIVLTIPNDTLGDGPAALPPKNAKCPNDVQTSQRCDT